MISKSTLKTLCLNSKTELKLLAEIKKIPSLQLDISNFKPKDSKFAYLPQEPKNQQPELNLQDRFSIERRVKVNLQPIKIEELGLSETIFSTLGPTNPDQFDDLKEISKSLKRSLIGQYDNLPKELHGSLPKIEKSFSIARNSTILSSKKPRWNFPSSSTLPMCL